MKAMTDNTDPRNKTPLRNLKAVTFVVLGAIAGIALYLICAVILSIVGFYTLSFGTGAFIGLAVAGMGVALYARASRAETRDAASPAAKLLTAGLLGTLALTCIAAIIWMPELIAFWPG